MEFWHFTEMPYPDIPPNEEIRSRNVVLPSRHFDPEIGHALYNRYYDEYMLADALGYNIMLNEHHATATCIDCAAPLSAAILARQTRRARILILGNPIANQHDPIRVAEEMAMIDCISGGRLDVGFVRGVPFELFPSNSNPTQTYEKLWEGIDLVLKAWAGHDGPFSYEGKYWHRRSVNVWPRVYQQPHPPIWITGGENMENVRKVAERGFQFASFLQPHERVRALYDAYREHCAELGLPAPGPDRFAYMPMVCCAETEKEAMEGVEYLLWFIRNKSEPQFASPPGYGSQAAAVAAVKGQVISRTGAMRGRGPDFLIDKGPLVAGTPDQVVEQIETFYERVGGFGHFLAMLQGGAMPHDMTVRSMTLFAEEVMPRLSHLGARAPADAAAGE